MEMKGGGGSSLTAGAEELEHVTDREKPGWAARDWTGTPSLPSPDPPPQSRPNWRKDDIPPPCGLSDLRPSALIGRGKGGGQDKNMRTL